MLKKLQAVAIGLCMLTYAAAGTVSIGTVSARGDMRVDSNTVASNATLFDGSVVETGQAPADLHLNSGAEITLATGSRGTLYSDRMVLELGKSEVSSSNSFKVEANGLRVTATEPNSRAMVSVRSGNTVQVAALKGSFGIANTQGVLVASVRPGQPLSFAIAAGAPSVSLHSDFAGTGTVSTEGGNYFLTVDGVKYQIKGKDLSGDAGKTVKIEGRVEGLIANGVVSGEPPAGEAIAVIHVLHHAIVGALAVQSWVIGGVAAGAAAGIAVGIYAMGNDGTHQVTPITPICAEVAAFNPSECKPNY